MNQINNAFSNIFSNAVNEGAKRATNSTDYRIGENGLLYCGKCNTAQEVDVTIFGQNAGALAYANAKRNA